MTAEQRAELVELARMAILYQQRPHCQIHSQLVIHDYLKSLRWPEADQVSREIIAETDVRNLLFLGVAIRFLDRSRMQIKTTEFRFRERLRHDERGDAMTTSDVRHASSRTQLLLDTVKRGIW